MAPDSVPALSSILAETTQGSGEMAGAGESEAALRGRLLDALGEAVIATDPDGRILYWNAAAERLYGWSADEVMGRQVLDIVPAEEVRGEADSIMETLRQGRSWSGQFLTRDRDGNHLPVMVTDTPLLDDAGKLVAIVGISRDATSTWDAESALRESGERLDLVRRASQSAIWELEPATGRIRWSGALHDLFGYRPEDTDGTLQWWLDRVHPEDRGRLERDLEAFRAGARDSWTREYRFRRADGSYAVVFDRAYLSDRPDGETRIAGALADLTERLRAREERRLLAEASMILDLSLDYEATLPTLVGLVTNVLGDLCVVHVTAHTHHPGFTAAGHSDPARQAATDRLVERLPDPTPDSITGRVLREGEPVLLGHVPDELPAGAGGDAVLAHLVGELDLASALVVPLRAQARVLGYMVIAGTEKRAPYGEEELRVAEELGRRAGAAVDNARLHESEQRARRAKDDFLAIVSHELRTPLTAVLGYADLLAEEIAGPLNGKQKQQVRRIHAATDRLHRILESILAYVRLETGRDEPRLEVVELEELLRRVRDVVEPRAREDGVAFRMDVDDVPDQVVTEPDWVLQILLALLTNALKFAREGEVRLVVSAADGELVMDVVDSGEGIPEEHRPYLFNPFWQAEQPATRRAGGAGLGLSVARRLARLLDGDVIVADSSPAGTTFRLRLPLNTPG